MLYGRIPLSMSTRSHPSHSLEITGNVLELPPVRDITKPLERKSIPDTPPKKRSSSLLSNSSASSLSKLANRVPSIPTTPKKPTDTKINDNSKEQIRQLEEEIKRLKKRIEELEAQLKSATKTNKDKDKQNEELTRKFDNAKAEANANTIKLQELEELCESLKKENENLMKQLGLSEDLNKTMTKAHDDNIKMKIEYETQIKKLKEEHIKEIKVKDEKLDILKKQIATAFKDNSWERQSQIEELTKELKKTQEEYEAIKYKLKGFKNKHADSCENCEEMLQKLNEKTKVVNEKEQLISELLNVMNKFKTQFNIQEDILKLTANKIFVDTNTNKFSTSQSKNSSGNSSIGSNIQANTLVKTKK